MAVIWQKQHNGKHYEVRTAGKTHRLYTDGVFHSQYNPDRTLTGNVWDLISLPAFFIEPDQIRRVLVLGVGGGAVMHQLATWFPEASITGIELDKTHISIAKKFFGLKGKQMEIIQADAISWVKRYRGLPFDIIIDDLFGEQEGEPVRVIEATDAWLNDLSRLLTDHGMLIMNFISSQQLRNSALLSDKKLSSKKWQRVFKMAYRFMTPLYENQIGAFLKTAQKKNQWRKHISLQQQLEREYEAGKSKYQIRKLYG